MAFYRMKLSLLAIISTLSLTGCATIRADVTSFHQQDSLTVGKTFAVIPLEDQKNSLEFKQYQSLLEKKLQEHGFILIKNELPDYNILFRYSIDDGREITSSYPVYGQIGGGTTTYHSGLINSYNSGFGTYSGTSYTTPNYGIIGTNVSSYTEYTRILNLDIFHRTTKEKVYEASVKSVGSSAIYSTVGECLIIALFKNFPGESGKTERLMISADECVKK